jgi:hypothetical protein
MLYWKFSRSSWIPAFTSAEIGGNLAQLRPESSLYYFRNIRFFFFPWPSLWSSDQSSWLQIQRSEFDSRLYQIFWEVVGLERSPLSLVSTAEELLGRKSSGSGLENRDYAGGVPPSWLLDTPLSAEVFTNFANKRRSLGRYSSEFLFFPPFPSRKTLALLFSNRSWFCSCSLPIVLSVRL